MTARRATQESSAATPTQPAQEGFSLIPNEKLLTLYWAMLKCRMLARQFAQAPRSGKRTLPAPALGHEATLAGIVVDLLPEDALSLAREDCAAAYLKGMPVSELQQTFFSGDAAAWRPNRMLKRIKCASARVIPPAPSADAQLHTACGVAYTLKMTSGSRIAAVLCNGFAPAPGAWREALAFAAQQQLPILFACQQSARSEAEGLAAQAQFDAIAAHAYTHRIPTITVDGHDAVAVYRVAYESIARARMGRGPTLIECRILEASAATSSKLPDTSDPIRKMEAYLLRKGILNPALKRKMVASVRREMGTAANNR